MRSTRIKSVVACGLIAGALVATPATRAMAEPAPSGGTSEALPNGSVRLTLPNGVVVVGSNGISAEVSLKASGITEVGTAAITPPFTGDPAAMAAAYQAAGRSPVADAIAAGITGKELDRVRERMSRYAMPSAEVAPMVIQSSGVIYDSFCHYDNDGNVDWAGCVIRSYDPNEIDPYYWYGIDDTQGTGHETDFWGWINLQVGGVKNNYYVYPGGNVTILQISPGSDITVGSCTTQGFGVTYGGYGVSHTGTVCPDRWDMTRVLTSNPRYHQVEWKGSSHDDREALALTEFKAQNNFTYTLYINWQIG